MTSSLRDAFSNSLIKTLKSARLSRGLSHEALAKKSGVSRQAIGKIEAGDRNPTLFTVYRLATAMEMSLEDFVRAMDL